MADARPVVVVWKSSWLPGSQTFVANQVGAMRRWRPLLLGVRRVPDGLPVAPDRAPFGAGRLGRGIHRLSAATGYLGVYDGVIRSSGATVVHAHFGTSAVGVLPVARRHGLPLVVTFHGYDVTSEARRTDPAGGRYRARLQEVFTYADTLIAVSDYVADRLVSLGAPAGKIRVQFIGIPTAGPEPAPLSSRRGIVFVGRIVERKGVADLLDAVAALPPELRSVPVTVVGDGPLRLHLQAASTSAGLDVTWRGFLTPARVAEVLRENAIFCAPSSTAASGDAEAFGMVHLEAALQGLPVVAYAHGGVPQAVADGVTGLLAPEKDVAALSEHLRTLLTNPGLASTLGAHGRERVLSDFDIVARTAELEDIYASAAARAR
ncbi:MAG TPA: glycosyltransferase [Cellulomonadaceae bacterium]|nr:glycosyltransferase [Cellulomonadaceae bacterium]